MANFDQAYTKLNAQQKLAVDTIDGPVLVIAGPGTGKTQLLSVRVANILAKTDALPDNILCLTFTDAAATEMQDRLVSLIGQQGYDVNVMTFHSFGSEIINRFPDYFYQGANMQPINEVTSYSLFREIFQKLPHSNPLSTTYFDEFTFLNSSQRAIKELKKAAISPGELRQILKDYEQKLAGIQPIIGRAFAAPRITKNVLPEISKVAAELQGIDDAGSNIINSLELALESGETKPVSEWKRKWLVKDPQGQQTIKDLQKIPKLLALADVYESYQSLLAKGHWFDYEDMVMQAVQKLTEQDELKAELQEQYQYLLVDEFQDTNDAQLKLVKALTDNPVNEGRPNILVVGDDDQAIYKFQGADITNMHVFANWVSGAEVISLNQIYRYPDQLLELSKNVIKNSSVRLKDQIMGEAGDLQAAVNHNFKTEYLEFENEFAEYDQVAQKIAQEIKRGKNPKDIAVIARQHSHLEKFAQYAEARGVPIEYDRKDNILEQPIIKEIVHFVRVVIAIANGNPSLTNQLIPELLSYRFWRIEPAKLWQLNARAKKDQQTWLDIMLEDEQFKLIAEELLTIAQSAQNDPLAIVLDQIISRPESSFYKYYFENSAKKIDRKYLQLLANLKTLRSKVIQFSGDDSSIKDLLEFVDLQSQAGIRLTSSSHLSYGSESVSLISAHKAKGLEFDDVYILHAQDKIWGSARRGNSNNLPWTANLTISPAGEEEDDRVRLFYVAITRAKKCLILSTSKTFNDSKVLPLRFLPENFAPSEQETSAQELAESYIIDWTAPHIEQAINKTNLLKPFLDNYRLSITHLQNFVDVVDSGPEQWLIYNLLQLPGPSIPAAAYGSAVHATLNEAQKYLQAKGQPKKIDQLLLDFEQTLKSMNLSAIDFPKLLDRGQEALKKFLDEKYVKFSQNDKSEVNFYGDNIVINGAKITGLADRLNLLDGDWQTGKVEIIDYKTGKSHDSWSGKSPHEKVKLYQYKQQLLFYQLMIKNSKRFQHLQIESSKLEFVEANPSGELLSLPLDASQEDLQRLSKLITAVWRRIQSLDLPNTSSYSQDLNGIIQLEEDLINSVD